MGFVKIAKKYSRRGRRRLVAWDPIKSQQGDVGARMETRYLSKGTVVGTRVATRVKRKEKSLKRKDETKTENPKSDGGNLNLC